MANDGNWNIDPSDDDFLRRQGANKRERVLAAGFADGVSPARIGEIAGYGAGKSNDPEKRRQNWSAAVSRAAKRGGQVIPRIQALIDALKHFRTNGEGPKVAAELEVLEKLSTVIRGSSDAQVISAGKALLESYRRGLGQTQVTAKDVVSHFVAKVGPTAAREGFRLLGAENLVPLVPAVDVVEAESNDLRALNGASAKINARLSTLEQRQL